MTEPEDPAPPDGGVPGLVDHLFRRQAGQVVAMLTRIFGAQYLDLAEDVAQDTLLKALRQWSYRGVPDNPAGWIMRVARNGALDALRRETSLREKQAEIAAALEAPWAPTPVSAEAIDSALPDDELRLLFTCCHPALSREARVALTLKTLGGFGVPEIARAFLTSEATIAQRLVRAKRRLREEAAALAAPDAADLPARLPAALDALYLLFNEGYSAHQGEDLVRHELCGEAIRLTSLLARHPAGDRPAVHALLALMLLQAARLPARTDAAGDLLLLAEQDRGRWDRRMIAAGLGELACAATGADLTEYHLQAGIAACHATAPAYEATDWERILGYYDDLAARSASPVVALNRAVALAMARGPAAGLTEIARIQALPGLANYYLLHATHGELAARTGDPIAARAAYRRALALTANEPERRFLNRKLSALAPDPAAERSPA